MPSTISNGKIKQTEILSKLKDAFCLTIPKKQGRSALENLLNLLFLLLPILLFWLIFLIVHESIHYFFSYLFGFSPSFEIDLLSLTPGRVIPTYPAEPVGYDYLKILIAAVSPYLLSFGVLIALLRAEREKYLCLFTVTVVLFYDAWVNLMNVFLKQGDFAIIGNSLNNIGKLIGLSELGTIVILGFIPLLGVLTIAHAIKFYGLIKIANKNANREVDATIPPP